MHGRIEPMHPSRQRLQPFDFLNAVRLAGRAAVWRASGRSYLKGCTEHPGTCLRGRLVTGHLQARVCIILRSDGKPLSPSTAQSIRDLA